MGKGKKEVWFLETEAALSEYTLIKGRIRVLKAKLRRDAGPDRKVIANYGINNYGTEDPGMISKDEVELESKETRLKELDAAINSLFDIEKKIIDLKYKQGWNNKMIYKKLFMGWDKFDKHYNEAIAKIAKWLGIKG